ncbi:MAG TPA: ATP synthase F1 subunit epsilon [Bacillota bacterium]|nr:ATP synthase F1 subunit epsilon [Bacillota bacterium]
MASGKSIQVEVVTPERAAFSGPATFVLARGTEGELGILPEHAPLITTLRDSVLMVRQPDGQEVRMGLTGGFLEVTPSRVTVLADGVRLPGEEDPNHPLAAPHSG